MKNPTEAISENTLTENAKLYCAQELAEEIHNDVDPGDIFFVGTHPDWTGEYVFNSSMAETQEEQKLIEYGLLYGELFFQAPANFAAMTDSVPLLELLQAKGISLNDISQCGDTPLHAAVESGSFNALKFLLDNGADLDAKNVSGHRPFDYFNKGVKILSTLYDLGEYEKYKNRQVAHKTALARIASADDIESLEYLYQKGEKLIEHVAGKELTSIAHVAAENDSQNVLEFMRKIGADFYSKNDEGRSVIEIITENRLPRQIDYLRREGYDLSQFDLNNKLFEEETRCNLDRIKELVAIGADIDAKCEFQHNLAFYASTGNRPDILQYLFEAGWRFDSQEELDITLLNAAESGFLEVMKFAHEHGANINARHTVTDAYADGEESTTLVAVAEAAYWGHIDCVKYLNEAGADMLASGSGNAPAIIKALDKERRGVIEYLAENSPGSLDVIFLDKPLVHWASVYHSVPLLKSLHEHGVDMSIAPPVLGEFGGVEGLHCLDVLGVDIEAPDATGATAYSKAEKSGEANVIDYIHSLRAKRGVNNLLGHLKPGR